jgi:hypothetical protein
MAATGANLRRAGIILGACLLFVGLASYPWYRHQYTLNINEMVETTGETKEKLFGEPLPSRHDIEDFLFNTTTVTSNPPIGNDVSYFDNQGKFVGWHGNEIYRGRWSTYPVTLTRTWVEMSREDTAQVFCRELDDGSLNQDNCVIITGTRQLVWPYGTHERVVGDIFNLSVRQKPPFAMPGTAITLAELKARLGSEPARR